MLEFFQENTALCVATGIAVAANLALLRYSASTSMYEDNSRGKKIGTALRKGDFKSAFKLL